MKRFEVVSGVTRTVVLTRRYAVKLPWGLMHSPLRGWLANRSEYHQRHRAGVNPVLWSGLHFVLVFERAEQVGGDGPRPCWKHLHHDGDEAKVSSWGWFDGEWLLIDYDRCWEHPRGWIGGLYYWNQERLGRRWSKLAVDDVDNSGIGCPDELG